MRALRRNKMTDRILVADDEDTIRGLFKRIIEREGYSMLETRNGEDAVKLYKENSKDIALVFTDNNMPIKDGLEASLEIKQEAEKTGRNVFIALMSGRLEKQDVPKHIDYFIQKPFENINDISDIIRGVYKK